VLENYCVVVEEMDIPMGMQLAPLPPSKLLEDKPDSTNDQEKHDS